MKQVARTALAIYALEVLVDLEVIPAPDQLANLIGEGFEKAEKTVKDVAKFKTLGKFVSEAFDPSNN